MDGSWTKASINAYRANMDLETAEILRVIGVYFFRRHVESAKSGTHVVWAMGIRNGGLTCGKEALLLL